jgi:general stress protein 26
MDSINRQQPEQNREDLSGVDALERIKALVKDVTTCFFCTSFKSEQPESTRPMSVQRVDDRGSLWFLSANDSHKNRDIETDPRVQLFFQGSAHSEFMTIHGDAYITTDREKIRDLWQPILKTWFTEGVDDPRITVIEVRPKQGYYWSNKHGRAVALAKMAVGAMTGKTLDDSIEGSLRV